MHGPSDATSPAVPTAWQSATVIEIIPETASAKSYRLRLEHPAPQLAGQHYVVRLTASDGYTAARSYSMASPPGDGREICLTVERLHDGEVSRFLHDELEPGDQLEVRGPIGGWFVWDGTLPALLIGGGSGVVPLVSMLRLARRIGRPDRLRLVISVRSPEELLFAGELTGPQTTIVYTRNPPVDDARGTGRLRLDDLPEDPARFPVVYICGSTGFADHVTDLLVAADVSIGSIRVERFGPEPTRP